jgi:hypothetical protein
MVAPTLKTIDARTYEDPSGAKYFAVFCARQSPDVTLPGHAYVVWGKEDPIAGMSSQEAFGYYNKVATLDMVLGEDVPGELRDESIKPMPSLITHRIIVKIDKEAFDESLQEKIKWKTGDYNLYKRNCISFSAAVAHDIGLTGVPVEADIFPATYSADLISAVRTPNGGNWDSTDASQRFALSVDGPSIAWTERSVTGSLKRDVVAKKGPDKNSFLIERPNTDEVLKVLGFADASLRAEILASSPKSSYIIVRKKQDKLEGEWHGLLVKKKPNGRLDSIVQPAQVPAKFFVFARN